jgi:hypothetical protein
MMRVAKAAIMTASILATAGCASTKFTTTWKAPDAQPGSLAGKKVVAVIVSQDEALRRGVEEILANELTRLGADGVAAYTLIPTSDIRDEAKAKAKLEEVGAAGAVVMRLVGRDKEVSSSPSMYYSGPNYGSFYGGYWGFGWGGVYDPGYLRTDTILHIETLVYSLQQNKLVWAGQSQTTNPKDADSLIRELVGQVASEMKKQGLLRSS